MSRSRRTDTRPDNFETGQVQDLGVDAEGHCDVDIDTDSDDGDDDADVDADADAAADDNYEDI